MEMEQTECSETAYKIQMPENYPEERMVKVLNQEI
jgi:hypothetical protein